MRKLFAKNQMTKSVIFLVLVLVVASVVQVTAKPSFIGNVIGSSIPANFGTYWNQVTSENAGKWGSVESSRDSMNWGSVDSHVNYANGRGIPYKFHCLVWGSQQPGWIGGLSASEQLAEVTEWIQAVGSRYKPAMIDVVNEPLHAVPSYSGALGGNGSTGWDWVIKSFQLARQYCGSSKLLINEYGVENDGAACDRYVAIIKLLKDRGLIDGIGIQTHCFNLNDTPVSTLQSNLNKLTALGLPVYASEFDLQGDDTTQANRYKEKFPIYYNGTVGITLWGYIQGQTWKSDTHLVASGSVGAAERPAMVWLKQYLSSGGTQPTATRTSTAIVRTATRTATAGAGTVTRTATAGAGTPTRTATAPAGGTLCTPSGSVSVPFTKDGAGEFCWETTALGSYINSWNMELLEVNGTNYTNKYVSSSSIAKVNNKYVIHYKASVAWAHFEAK